MNSRLTTATMYSSLMSSLQQSQRGIQELQQQIATGNKYNNLTENPSAVTQSLAMQSALNANDKYQQNTTNAITMLRYADSAMNNVLDAAQAIRSLIIQAGDGALDATQLKDITAQIEANKKIMLDNLNTKVAGQYIFGGTDTTIPPFVEQEDGRIVYQGSDERIKYAVNDGLLGDVGFAGSDIMQENDDSYFICSHYVPLDWEWTGREEKVQITVGNRTLSVFIPEDWSDYVTEKSSANSTNTTDYNRFRDPGEHVGLSLDDLATIVNRSLEEQGADMLVHVTVEKDYENGTQQMIMKSNTGEKIGITGWPDTDYMPMPATITSNEMDSDEWKEGYSGGPNGLMGTNNILSWKGSDSSGDITITMGSTSKTFQLKDYSSSTDLITAINREFPKLEDGTPFASFSTGNLKGRLILQTDQDNTITVTGTGTGAEEIFGTTSVTSTSASFSVKVGDDDLYTTKIFINAEDTLADVAAKVDSIEGVLARTSGDGKSISIVAQKTGSASTDRLVNKDAQEELYCPSLTITVDDKDYPDDPKNEARRLFGFEDGSMSIKATSERRQLDHSHIDVFDALGMETAMKSREFAPDEKLTIEDGTELHWRVISGGRSADIKLNAGTYTAEDLADRIRNAAAGWLEVTLEADSTETALTSSGTDAEAMTHRLVIRGFNGEQVLFLDMNAYNYADQMGLSTALRTDAYTKDDSGDVIPGTGTKCVNFPSAPCVDDNVGVPLRVQMNCGMYYDVNIKRAEVVNPKTGFVDRTKVMQAIVDEVNAQEGHNIMGITVHVDKTGKEIPESAAIYFLSGEAFTVVDMPFNDPEWNDYSGGIAAQMGIHGGVSSNLKVTAIPMKDSKHTDSGTFEAAYTLAGETFRPSTIRFSNMGHEVEIDVSAADTVKDVMDRLRSQAGDWLYVNYYDEHMGQEPKRNTGDFPIISISSVDGSAVSIVDVKGHVAQDALGISTGVQTRINDDGTGGGLLDGTFEWDMSDPDNFPATEMTITVAGYSHTIDLTEIRDVTKDTKIDARDIAEFVNARMQDYDVRAEVNEDGELMLWSMRGYSVEMTFADASGDVTDDFMGNEDLNRSYYRGGWNMDGNAETRGLDASDFYQFGIHSQNATIRSGANTMRQNGFGVIDDVISAIESGNRDSLVDKLLPKIDDIISNILSVMSEDGALQARYTYNNEKLIQESAIMTESYDNLMKIDPAEAISQLMVADYAYQANLAVISRLIQPSLLDFLK